MHLPVDRGGDGDGKQDISEKTTPGVDEGSVHVFFMLKNLVVPQFRDMAAGGRLDHFEFDGGSALACAGIDQFSPAFGYGRVFSGYETVINAGRCRHQHGICRHQFLVADPDPVVLCEPADGDIFFPLISEARDPQRKVGTIIPVEGK